VIKKKAGVDLLLGILGLYCQLFVNGVKSWLVSNHPEIAVAKMRVVK
jgi:hypothetical protein